VIKQVRTDEEKKKKKAHSTKRVNPIGNVWVDTDDRAVSTDPTSELGRHREVFENKLLLVLTVLDLLNYPP